MSGYKIWSQEVNVPSQFLVTLPPFYIFRSVLAMITKYVFIVAIFFNVLQLQSTINGESHRIGIAIATTYLNFTVALLMDISSLILRIFSLLLKEKCKETGVTTMDIIHKTRQNVVLYKEIVKGAAPLLLVIFSFSTLLVIVMAFWMVKDTEQSLTMGGFYVWLGLSTIYFLSGYMEDAYDAIKDTNEILRHISFHIEKTKEDSTDIFFFWYKF